MSSTSTILTRLFLTLIAVGLFVFFVFYIFSVKGGTTLGVTLNTQPDLERGLVGHWTFDGNDVSGSTINDRSGQGNNGTFSDVASCAVATESFSTAGSDTYTVPSGCTSVTVKTWGGGGGGGGNGGTGGGGGFAQATIVVTAGETLDVLIGGAGGAGAPDTPGSAGTNGGGAGGDGDEDGGGGGGGGYSSVQRSGTYLVQAGGGGGGGGGGTNGGGAGGGESGDAGTSGGGGGDQSSGGTGAGGGTDGSANQGGAGDDVGQGPGGGGGGGGQFGGGGGDEGGGGGGGSGLVTGTDTTLTTGSGQTAANTGDEDYAGSAGQGGASETDGNAGLVVITTVGGGGGSSATTRAGVIGQALEFDGLATYVNVGNAGAGIQTISFWMKAATSTLNQQLINIDGSDRIETNGSGNIVATSFPAATIYVDASSASANIPDTNWHHVVVTDTTGVSATAFDIASTTQGLFGGGIDDVRVYDRVLSQEEITRLYHLGATTKIGVTLNTQPDLERGLIGHWTFDGPDLIENVTDRSGQGLHGNLKNFTSTTTAPGRIGQALKFDSSTNNIVVIENSANAYESAPLLVSAWFKLDTLPSVTAKNAIFVATRHSVSPFFGWAAYVNKSNDKITWTIFDSSDVLFSVAEDSVAVTGRWYHIVGILDANFDLSLYVDGILQSGTADAASLKDTNANASIGAAFSASVTDGLVDDVRIYNRALSQEDVTRLYNLGK